jgi:hypothetical protein
MGSPEPKPSSLKHRLREELVEYLINAAYLAFFFCAFTIYRRLVLASYDITYTNYWVALIEALVLGKVISIGSVFRLGRALEAKPLIFPALHKTVIFTILCQLFTLAEHGIKGLLKGEGFTAGVRELVANGPHDLLANALMIFVGLLPYFAVRELGRVIGTQSIRALFFRNRDVSGPPTTSWAT